MNGWLAGVRLGVYACVCLRQKELGKRGKKLDERMCVKGKRRWRDTLLIYRAAFLQSRLGAA